MAASAIPPGSYAVVTGYFDPLTADHARRLAQIRAAHEKLIVVVNGGDDGILPSSARAELIAALAVVDYVVIGETPDAVAIYHDEPEHEQLLNELVAHVGRRHQS